MSNNPSLTQLEEGPLDFDPTYKYDIGTNNYDTSNKKRIPSWCDRILFKKNSNVEIVKYDRVNYLTSDHKPIYGIYKVNVKRILAKEKEKIIKELKESTEISNNIDLSSKFV